MYSTIVLAYGKANHLNDAWLLQSILLAVGVEPFTIPIAGLLSDRLRPPPCLYGRRAAADHHGGAVLPDAEQRRPPADAPGHDPGADHRPCAVLCAAGSMFPELFPARVRCSGIALIWQIGSLIAAAYWAWSP